MRDVPEWCKGSDHRRVWPLELSDAGQPVAVAAAGADRGDLATKADLAAAIAVIKADMLKVAIGVVIANATLTAVLVFGALRLLQP